MGQRHTVTPGTRRKSSGDGDGALNGHVGNIGVLARRRHFAEDEERTIGFDLHGHRGIPDEAAAQFGRYFGGQPGGGAAARPHGAKACAFIRVRTAAEGRIRIYTPHGGSLHYPLTTLKGNVYARVERALMNNTDLFLFESAFARDTYQRTIGTPKGLVRCVFNGVTANEFDPVVKAEDATELIYVGEFRRIKGADLLIDAVARLRADGRQVTLTLAGDGEESENLKAQVQRLGLGEAVRFIGHVKARYGFSKGSLLVVPSRGDSMPYVVIEAAAAGIPMVAANVGGIPEIFGSHTDALFAPNNAAAMAKAIEIACDDPAAALERARSLRERIFMHFSQKAMVEGVLAGYGEAFANR